MSQKQPTRRGFPTTRPYVIGSNILNQAKTRLVYHAIGSVGDRNPSPIERTTPAVKKWHFWATKQAANQWRNRRPHLRQLEVRNLNSQNVQTS
jgi:hypothetical protein